MPTPENAPSLVRLLCVAVAAALVGGTLTVAAATVSSPAEAASALTSAKARRAVTGPTMRTSAALISVAKARGATSSPGPSASPTTANPAASPEAVTEPVARTGRSLGWFYRPPTGSDAASLTGTFDRYILTHGDEATRDALRAAGQSGPMLMYLRFEGIMNPVHVTWPWLNNVAYQAGDFATISRQHPDWFLLDAAGRRVVAGTTDGIADSDVYLMDPGNAGWRTFLITRAQGMMNTYGWDGLFLDDIELSLAKRQRYSQIPAKYPTDASWAKANLQMLTWLKDRLGGTRLVEANLIEQRTQNDPQWHTDIDQLSGGMREGWLGWSDSDYLSPSQYALALDQVTQSQKAGKHVWLVAVGSQANTARALYTYASYLLVDDGLTSFRYTNPDNYDAVWPYAMYGRDLGAPLGGRYLSGAIWKRNFSNGTVSVNPTTHVAAVG
jgi:hypothetical protein